MAKADDGITTDRMRLGAAHALLVEAYGASRIADELLREELAAERLPWGAPLVKGPAPGPKFWRSARIDYSESSAREGHLFFILGDGADLPRISECYGVWVSRAHVLALLPEEQSEPRADGYSASKVWITAEVKALKADGEIPAKIGITDLARLLERRMNKAARRDHNIRPIKWTSIKNKLKDWGLWPVTSIK